MCMSVSPSPAGIDENGGVLHLGKEVLVADLLGLWRESAADCQEV